MWKAIERLKQAAARNRDKAIVNSPPPTYEPEPEMVADDDEMSKEKEIDKLMALISMSFKEIYKPTNNNVRTSSNTRNANVDNTLRTNRGTGYDRQSGQYDNQRAVNVVGARENVARQSQKSKRAKDSACHKEKMLLCKQEEAGIQLSAEQVDWRDDTNDEPKDQELEAHYLYMAKIQEVTLDAADNSGPIFDAEPLQKVQNNDDAYNVFANDRQHPEQPESVNDTYLADQGDTNITPDSSDMSINREKPNQDDKLTKERDLLASLIEKLKCEIDDSKKRQSVQTMNMFNRNCKTSFVKPEFLKKAKSVNPRLYDIGCYNDNVALMLAPESDETIRLTQEKYYYADYMNAILGVYTKADEVTNLQCDYLEALEKCQSLENELLKINKTSKGFEAFQQHAINLKLALQQCQEQIKNDKAWKQKESSSFRELNDKSFKIQDLEAQLQDKNIAISELKKLIEKMKGKYVETKSDKSSVARQPNAFKSKKQSVLVTAQILPQKENPVQKNTNVIAPGMYKVYTRPNKTRTTQLSQDIRKTNKRVSFSTGIIPTISVSRLQLKSNRLEDRVLHNNSQGKKQEVEDHRRIFKLSNNKTSVTACNDNLNIKTSNVNFVRVTCEKYVLNNNHDMCVLHYINGVNSRTKKPIDVPISIREPKRTMNQSVATLHKRTVALESTKQKPRSTFRRLYEHVSKTCSWWYPKLTPPGYKRKPKSKTRNVKPNVSMPLGNESRTANILEPKTVKNSNVSNTPLSSNSFAARNHNSIHRRLWVLKAHDEKSQASQSGLRECHYQKGLLCQRAESQFILGSRGTDIYSITLQDTTSPNPICLIAKATSSQAWLWHRRLSHLNFDTINLLLKNDIVIGLPKLKFFKDHLCSSCELGKSKQKSFKTKLPQAPKDDYNFSHGLMWSHEGRKHQWSKYETPNVLIDFLKLVQRGLHAQVRTVQTDNNTEFLNKTLHEYFSQEGIEHQTSVARTPEQNGISKGYRVYNKRTRVIVETIHVNFDELPLMASDHVSSDPAPQCPKMALEHDSLSPDPQSQVNVPQAAETITTLLNELNMLFSLRFDEYFTGATIIVSNSSIVPTADASDKRQQQNITSSTSTTVAADLSPLIIQTTTEPTIQTPTQAPTVTVTENNDQAEIQA
ncbi:retrovirus-related pol polyprotein from transposon TNT 1-94 [Tanacetum coccineum]